MGFGNIGLDPRREGGRVGACGDGEADGEGKGEGERDFS